MVLSGGKSRMLSCVAVAEENPGWLLIVGGCIVIPMVDVRSAGALTRAIDTSAAVAWLLVMPAGSNETSIAGLRSEVEAWAVAASPAVSRARRLMRRS